MPLSPKGELRFNFHKNVESNTDWQFQKKELIQTIKFKPQKSRQMLPVINHPLCSVELPDAQESDTTNDDSSKQLTKKSSITN